MQRNYWKRKIIVLSFIVVESLLFIIGMTKPAFSSYFSFSRQYKNGLKQIHLSGQFKARDLDRNGEISAREIEDFQGKILYHHQRDPEIVSLLDNISFKDRLEFEHFKYNLTNNHLEFSVRTRQKILDSLVDSVDSHWRVNFKQESDHFFIDQNKIIGTDAKGTGKIKITRKTLLEIDTLIILLILGLILFRINQQIHIKAQANSDSKTIKFI